MTARDPDSYYEDMAPVWSRSYPSTTSLPEYDEYYRSMGVDRSVSSLVADLMALVPVRRGRLLDFGCDNGVMLNFFRDYDLALFGVDINRQSIERGRTLYPDFDLRTSTGLEIPFEDDFFDVVLAAAVLKHIRPADRGALYDEFQRVSSHLLVFEEVRPGPCEEKMGDFTFYHADFGKELAARFHPVHAVGEGSYLFGVYRTSAPTEPHP